MRQFGGELDPRLECTGAFSESSGYDAAQRLLDLSPRPTAVFASNDSMAIGALSALRDRGVQVPEEIALAGFDDVPIASFLTPTLSSVQVGIHQLGVRAIETLLHAVRHKNTHRKQQVVLPTKLSLRESCSCTNSTSTES
jgi:LacI family transcriptional regulator